MSADTSFITFYNVKNLSILSWLEQNEDEIEVSFSAHGRNLPSSICTELNESIDNNEEGEDNLHNSKTCSKKTKSENIPHDLSGNTVENGVIRKMNQKVVGMIDSSGIYKKRDGADLWSSFTQNGYVLLRGLLKRDDVLTASQYIKDQLKEMKLMKRDGTATSKVGWTVDRSEGAVIVGTARFTKDEDNSPTDAESWMKLAQGDYMQKILDSDALKTVLRLLAEGKSRADRDAGGDAATVTVSHTVRNFDPNFTWIRIKAPKEFTPDHADVFFFKTETDMFKKGLVQQESRSLKESSKCNNSSAIVGASHKRRKGNSNEGANSAVDDHSMKCFKCAQNGTGPLATQNIAGKRCNSITTDSNGASSHHRSGNKSSNSSSGSSSSRISSSSSSCGGSSSSSSSSSSNSKSTCTSGDSHQRSRTNLSNDLKRNAGHITNSSDCTASDITSTDDPTSDSLSLLDNDDDEEDDDDVLCVVGCDECGRNYHFHTECLPEEVTTSKTTTTKMGKSPISLRASGWYCPKCLPRPLLGTCWIPMGDVSVEDGVLAILPGSANLPRFDKYVKPNQIPTSYKKHGKGLTWHTGPYEAGDVVLFDSRTIHCTSRNYGTSYRISMDFRWYLSPDRGDDSEISHERAFVDSHSQVYD